MANSTPSIIAIVSAAKVLRTMCLIRLDCQFKIEFVAFVYKEYNMSS